MSNNNNEINININIKITKKHLTIALIAIVTTSLIIPYQIFANSTPQAPSEESFTAATPVSAPLSGVFCIPTAGAVAIQDYYTVIFTTATTGAIKSIDIAWSSGYSVSSAVLIERTDTSPGIGAGTISVAGSTVTYTVTGAASSVAAGTTISIMLGGIVNPTGVTGHCTITTKTATSAVIDGPTSSAAIALKKVGTVQIAPGAVTGGTGGSIATGTIGLSNLSPVLQSLLSRLDIVTTNDGSSNVSVLLATGGGGFSAATNFAAGTGPLSVAVGDFNGDGKLDLAVANFSSNNVSVLLGNGDGTFGAATNFAVGTAPFSLAIGDFNGDGKLDLAVANEGSNNASILLGTGTGSFGAATNFAVGTEPVSVAVGDFNGDGKLDLAVANEGSANASILLGTGTGSFGAATNFAVGTNPESVAVAHLGA